MGHPFSAIRCPSHCAFNRCAELVGIGRGAVRCRTCKGEASPSPAWRGYQVVFDTERPVDLTLGP